MRSRGGATPNDMVRDFATSSRGLVVAPAGCGKTELIADAVLASGVGKQLILTHTHAGVRALRTRLQSKKADPVGYFVDTISGFSLRYASAFQGLSGWRAGEPSSEEWPQVYEAAWRALQNRHVRGVFTSTYAGLFVDEYQDCTVRQHKIIDLLADFIPTRIVGDPLQGIFDFSGADAIVDWTRNVYPSFRQVGDLQIPHRWLGPGRNADLGQWLLDARGKLLSGVPLSFDSAGPVQWRPFPDSEFPESAQIGACQTLLRHPAHETVAVIRKMPHQAHHLAKNLGGTFHSMEEVECRDLTKWCDKLEASAGLETARLVIEFALACMTVKPSCLTDLGKLLAKGELPGDRKLKNHAPLKDIARTVATGSGPRAIGSMLQVIAKTPGVILYRRELFREMQSVMRCHPEGSTEPLRRTAWRIRDRERHFDRPLDGRVVSRTLLIKGLKFDHAILVDAEEFDDAKNLYVALTRASKSLTVMSRSRTIKVLAPGLASPLIDIAPAVQLGLGL